MNDKQENKKEGLYEYIKEHPSILISILSGIVIIVGFLFKVLIYMNECRYLEYWHLNKLMININDQNQIYEMVTICFLYLTIVLTQCFVSATLSYYQNRTQIVRYNKILMKSVKKEYKKIKKKYEICYKSTKDMDETIQIGEEWEKIVSGLDAEISDYSEGARNLHRRILKNNRINVLFSLIFSTMSLAGTIYLYFAISSSIIEWEVYFLTLILFVIIIWGVSYIGVLLNCLMAYFAFKKKAREEKAKICKQQMQDYIDNKEDYVLTKILNFDIRNYINRKSLFSAFVYAIIIFITFVGFINMNKTSEMINNKTFGMLEYDNVNCAIVYRDDSFIYLEECIIEDDTMTIFIDKQRRIENGELFYINREFADVIRIDLNGNVVE